MNILPPLDEEPAIVTRVVCRCCGCWADLYIFGSCRPCANRGKVRAMLLAQIRADLGTAETIHTAREE